VPINKHDGRYQASYWLDASKIEHDPDDFEYSEFLLELKDRIQKLLRQGRFEYAAIFQWNAELESWDLVEEFELGNKPSRSILKNDDP
jgi:hypothetical protein